MRVLVTGGCGYTGSVLVPKLLAAGHEVTVVDTMWFGCNIPSHKNLLCIRKSIADLNIADIGQDAVIHLAAIANDPTGDLDPKLTWETNALMTMQLAEGCAATGVKQFIYASSGSVYGVSDLPEVTEDAPLNPISEYNKTKMVAERCVLSYSDKMAVQIIRPATVCGVSPRMRLDVVVNMLTMQALTKREITVLGGSQMRPNIHIEDLTDLYVWMLNRPHLTGIFNAGFQNMSVSDIAHTVWQFADSKVVVKESNDPRSYRMDSQKLIGLGFSPKRSVNFAIKEMCEAYRAGTIKDEDNCYNIRSMPR